MAREERGVTAMDETLARIWENLAGRLGGPLTSRLILQPLVAAILALRAGLDDARLGRRAYFWTLLGDPNRRDLVREGWTDVAKVFVLALGIDVVYQIIRLRWIYPGEALIVAVMLALVPYLVIRGFIKRLARSLAAEVVSDMESSDARMDTGTRLAVDRTRLAYERTLMAWIRTAVSMITFGFTIYKFFQFELRDRPVPSGSVLGPHGVRADPDRNRARVVAAVDRPAPAEHAGAARRVRQDRARVRRRDSGGPLLDSGAPGVGHGAAAMVNRWRRASRRSRLPAFRGRLTACGELSWMKIPRSSPTRRHLRRFPQRITLAQRHGGWAASCYITIGVARRAVW